MNFTDRFLRDIARHQLTILRDDGVYRHLRFQVPGTAHRQFDLVTWPGYLAYTGDMGAFVFTRVQDMFNFFRRELRPYDMDMYYWAEKCEAADKHDGVREFNHAQFRRRVREHLRGFISDTIDALRLQSPHQRTIGVKALRELRGAVREDVLQCDDNEVRAYDAACEFAFSAASVGDTEHWRDYFGRDFVFEFTDFWEADCKVFSHRFQWCCHALVWGIEQYDGAKEAARQLEAA